jgi:hypothetical protein
MAEGTRVAQLTESLAKLKEDCLVENQKVSQLANSFRTQQDAINQLRADNQAFQKKTCMLSWRHCQSKLLY